MNLILITRIIALVGVGLGILGILMRLRDIMARPFKSDLSRARGSWRRGVLYAFTLGMAPWEKESTRIHWIAYFRGILFHIGVFAAIGILIVDLWLAPRTFLDWAPGTLRLLAMLITLAGAVAGFAGIAIRLHGENERSLSLPDDYFSVFLTSGFVGFSTLSLLSSSWTPALFLVSAVLSVYIPFSKIRHCVYFFYSKFFFGLGFGHRGVIGQVESEYSE